MIVGPHGASDWLYLAGVPILAGAALCELYSRYRAGSVLLDLGSRPGRAIQLGAGFLMLGLGCIEAPFLPGSMFMGLFYAAFGGMTLVFATRRFQIRQSGIFVCKLFRWEEIEEYRLGPRGDLALKVKGKDWSRPVARVSSELWERANRVLASRLLLSAT